MSKISDINWTQHIYMCKTWEKTYRGHKIPSNETACPFHIAAYSEICPHFIEFGQNCYFQSQFFASGYLEMAKFTKICKRISQKIPISTCNFFVRNFLSSASIKFRNERLIKYRYDMKWNVLLTLGLPIMPLKIKNLGYKQKRQIV